MDENALDFERTVETYCNRVAGEVLVPKEALLEEQIVKRNVNNIWSDNDIRIYLTCSWLAEVILRIVVLGKLPKRSIEGIKSLEISAKTLSAVCSLL